MSAFLLAPVAVDDLEAAWDYYAFELENIEAADRIRDELFAAMRELAKTPGMGHFRSDLSPEPLRFWKVRRYLIIYRSEKRPIEIVRVLHGSQDVRTILETDSEEPSD
jgi:plasmid stabilization system protein ParE